ncbi:VanW family protein [Salirhabdus euzebyi]|uniref:VanW family protein n=1 Tax=Salirhabdus euzebyi TaxID=394506 RepID=UPI00157B742E|nr:VanW family protein [Salirhabdus euzebyi]
MSHTLLTLLFLLSTDPTLANNTDKFITHKNQKIMTLDQSAYSFPALGDSFLNHETYEELVQSINKKVFEKPKNATINKQGKIVQGEVGYELDEELFRAEFYQLYFTGGKTELEVPRKVIYPKVDSELLASIRTQQIGRYETYFNKHNEERTHNMKLATKAINNHVIFPKETFSFNEVVGKRTEEKGYLPAPVIVKGELTEGIGGGICQVSSTLYNAVDQAGAKIVQRYSHSKSVQYVPPGRDATVSWYGPDFVFKNIHNQPLLIQAKVVGGTLSITIHSSEVIYYKPRKVPDAPNELPKEIEIG